MGSLKTSTLPPLGSKNFEHLALFLILAAVGLPWGWALWRWLLEAQPDSLSFIFLWTLGRAFIFSSTQAAVSALVACAMGAALGLFLAHRAWPWTEFLQKTVGALGLFIYILPGTALALAVLGLGQSLPSPLNSIMPTGGWGAVVLAHVLWNVGLVAAVVARRLRAFYGTQDRESLEAALLMGARNGALLRTILWPLLRPELLAWARLIFLWSFGAFSTVLILGEGPRHANPEVLLFYTLFNDGDAARLLVLSLLQALTAWWLARGTSRWPAVFEPGTQSGHIPLAARYFCDSALWRHSLTGLSGLSLGFMAWLLVFPLFGLWACVSSGACGQKSAALGPALLHSVFLAACTGGLTVLGGLLLLLSTDLARRTWTFLFCLSPTLLGALWWGLPWEGLLRNRPLLQLTLAALALSLLQLPFAALWIRHRLSSLKADAVEAAWTLGAPLNKLPRALWLPWSRDILVKLGTLSACLALGELAITSIFVREAPLLAAEARLMASRYDFAGSALVLAWTLLLSAVFMGVAHGLRKRPST